MEGQLDNLLRDEVARRQQEASVAATPNGATYVGPGADRIYEVPEYGPVMEGKVPSDLGAAIRQLTRELGVSKGNHKANVILFDVMEEAYNRLGKDYAALVGELSITDHHVAELQIEVEWQKQNSGMALERLTDFHIKALEAEQDRIAEIEGQKISLHEQVDWMKTHSMRVTTAEIEKLERGIRAAEELFTRFTKAEAAKLGSNREDEKYNEIASAMAGLNKIVARLVERKKAIEEQFTTTPKKPD